MAHHGQCISESSHRKKTATHSKECEARGEFAIANLLVLTIAVSAINISL